MSKRRKAAPPKRPKPENKELTAGSKEPLPFPRNDDERAARFAIQFKDELKYVGPWKCWMEWNGQRWVKDENMEGVAERASKMVGIFENEAVGKDEHKLALSWGNAAPRRAMIEIASQRREVQLAPDQFDADPWSVGLPNGVLDLRTDDFRDPERGDLITKSLGVAFDPKATCPRWEQFQLEIHQGDAELVRYKQRLLGYCLTGLTHEQVFHFLYGVGQNGKSTETGIWTALWGDYVKRTQSKLVTNRGGIHQESETMIADLAGARLVIGAECAADVRLNAAIVKDLTGDDVLVGRHLYERQFSFKPTFKIFGYGNHRPTIFDMDKGIWRRLRVIPYEFEVPEAQRDFEIVNKLLAELPGILNWALEGFLQWKKQGLGSVKAVQIATDDYHEEEDEIGEFIRAHCVLDLRARVRRDELYEKFRDWSMFEQHVPENRVLGAKMFANRLRGGGRQVTDYKPKINSYRAWQGIELKAN